MRPTDLTGKEMLYEVGHDRESRRAGDMDFIMRGGGVVSPRQALEGVRGVVYG